MGYPRIRQQHPYEPAEWTWRIRGGQFLLRPDRRAVAVILGVLGRVMARLGNDLHLYYVAIESNHLHLWVACASPQIAATAKTFIATNISKEIGRLRSTPRGGIWTRRCRSIPIVSGLLDRLVYGVAHGYKSGLVARIEDWPGLGFLPALLEGRTVSGVWYDRDQYGQALLAWRRRKRAWPR